MLRQDRWIRPTAHVDFEKTTEPKTQHPYLLWMRLNIFFHGTQNAENISTESGKYIVTIIGKAKHWKSDRKLEVHHLEGDLTCLPFVIAFGDERCEALAIDHNWSRK